MYKLTTEIFSSALDLIMPRLCFICQRRSSSSIICKRCIPAESIHHINERCEECFSPLVDLLIRRCDLCANIPSLFRRTRYLWEYSDNAATIIKIMKYSPDPLLVIWAGKRLLNIADFGIGFDLVVPVPPSLRALWQRGFGVTDLLAREVSQELGVEFSQLAMQCKGFRSAQASLHGKERLVGIKDAFKVESRIVKKKRILLVDDVVTTGATSSAAALALCNAGAESVSLLALARSPTWVNFRQLIYRKIR